MKVESILFTALLAGAVFLFVKNIKKIRRNIRLGKDTFRSDDPSARWRTMIRVALGQSKMITRPVAGVLHIVVYAGFIIINIEVLEIIIDGLFGLHRAFSFLGVFYDFLIGSFEVLALLVAVSCLIFLLRRNLVRIARFRSRELAGWPRSDANAILITEVLLMSAFLVMNASDLLLQKIGAEHYVKTAEFPVSSYVASFLSPLSAGQLIIIERGCWWFHIIGILAFLNYLPYSKHFHILLAFPNTYYSNLKAKGAFNNMVSVTNEVKLMFDPSASPLAPDATPGKFGAKDVTDFTWKQLMDAYSCTECGRCTSSCPANQTGKKLSPRKIMMDTRDRLEEYGKNIDKHGKNHVDNKSLLGDYISTEEVWACTSCNACVQECPVNIDPLSIILDLRRYLVMEQSSAPTELAMMFTNIENNGAPWQFSQADRLNWKNEA